MLFVNKHQIFTSVTTEKTEENFSSSTALKKSVICSTDPEVRNQTKIPNLDPEHRSRYSLLSQKKTVPAHHVHYHLAIQNVSKTFRSSAVYVVVYVFDGETVVNTSGLYRLFLRQ